MMYPLGTWMLSKQYSIALECQSALNLAFCCSPFNFYSALHSDCLRLCHCTPNHTLIFWGKENKYNGTYMCVGELEKGGARESWFWEILESGTQ